MNDARHSTTAAIRYDRALNRGQKRLVLPTGCPVPKPTAYWPKENVTLLERYRDWLVEGGVAQSVIEQHRIPMAGHVLGLFLKHHSQLDLTSDLDKAMVYIKAKRPSHSWLRNSRHSLKWFRRFLRLERGLVTADSYLPYSDISRYQKGLPDWLLDQLEQYLHIRQANWRQSRLKIATYGFWQKYTHLWLWLYTNQSIVELHDIKRQHLFNYIDELIIQGCAPSSINQYLYTFQAMLRFLHGRGFQVAPALLKVSGLKQPDRLPRFLTNAQVIALQNELDRQVQQADTPARVRNALLNRATFYLLWQGGLRVGQLEELSLADIDISKRRFIVRQGKGLKDRTVYLTDAALIVFEDYLEVRGPTNSDHVFIYRFRPLSVGLVWYRLKEIGKRIGVKVTPHMLRHTFATQLVNAGCRITTIQSLLGHNRLNSTMAYARVHDHTVAEEYYSAMTVIEGQLNKHPLSPKEPVHKGNGNDKSVQQNGKCHLLALVNALDKEHLSTGQQFLIDELRSGIRAMVANN